ncbi:MAG: metal ABC transporter permease [Candidatus Schekmanbacteria bacterium]|nr:metal ABC transporter permease [Candidatus Schekmanbacteria bacterium]
MIDFFRDMSSNPFLLTGLLAGLLASVACGIVGPYVVTRRIVFLAAAIAHMAVGGVGAAIFAATMFPGTFGWLAPIHGAAISSVAGAVLLSIVHHRVREQLDTLIGALWAIGMAIGIVLIKFTPGYHTELMSYLFGNIVFVSPGDVWLMAGIDLVIVVVALLYHKRFLALCLDAEQAQLQGIGLLSTNMVLLVLVALTVICLTQVVGLILVIALLSLPAATASRFVPRLAGIIWVSIALNAFLTVIPRAAVYGLPVSPEPAIVIAAAAVYVLATVARFLRPRGR